MSLITSLKIPKPEASISEGREGGIPAGQVGTERSWQARRDGVPVARKGMERWGPSSSRERLLTPLPSVLCFFRGLGDVSQNR